MMAGDAISACKDLQAASERCMTVKVPPESSPLTFSGCGARLDGSTPVVKMTQITPVVKMTQITTVVKMIEIIKMCCIHRHGGGRDIRAYRSSSVFDVGDSQ